VSMEIYVLIFGWVEHRCNLCSGLGSLEKLKNLKIWE